MCPGSPEGLGHTDHHGALEALRVSFLGLVQGTSKRSPSLLPSLSKLGGSKALPKGSLSHFSHLTRRPPSPGLSALLPAGRLLGFPQILPFCPVLSSVSVFPALKHVRGLVRWHESL